MVHGPSCYTSRCDIPPPLLRQRPGRLYRRGVTHTAMPRSVVLPRGAGNRDNLTTGQQDDPKALGRLHARRKLQARSCTSGDNPATMRQPVQPGTYWQSRAANTPWSAPPTTTAAGQPYPRQILGPSNSALSKPNRCGERREGGRLTYPLLPRRGTRPRVSWQCSATRHPGMLVRVSEW